MCRFKIDLFLWSWQNASGKAETNILLIRFFILSTYNLLHAGDMDMDALGFDFDSSRRYDFDASRSTQD